MKARILLLEDNEHEEVNAPSIVPVEETMESKIGLKDDLEGADDSNDPLPSTKPVGDIEADPLDEYMKEIETQAVPQDKGQHKEDLDDMDWEPASDLEDEDYQQQFMAAFKENFTHIDSVPTLAESASKPQVMHQEDDDAAWELLLMEEDDENYLRLVSVTQQKRASEKRELPTVDHSQVAYTPFRKDLYIPCPDVSRLSAEEVITLREDLGGINVRGKRCPAPISNWYQCGLSDKVLKELDRKQFKGPFPIQAQAIPAIMAGRDVIGIAETGSGKTLAYLLPMFRHVLDQSPVADGEGPIAVIMSPTRELTTQIYKEAKVNATQGFCKHLNIRTACVYGGSGVTGQLAELKRGVEVVVCTPGRMIDVLCLSNGKITNLRRVTYLVVDEADRMFDLGFEPQIMKIVDGCQPGRQTVMFSATFPKHVEKLAKRILTKPVEILVGLRNQTCQFVEQFVEVVSEEDKFPRLLEVLKEWYSKGNILIFVERHNEADELFLDLVQAGFDCLVLHGQHDQTDRDGTIADFKKGVKTVLVATSIAARGLDVKSLVLVINYRCPNHMEDYIHRIGRTGRAGKKGTSITFITPEEMKYAYELVRVLEQSNQEVPEELQELALEFKQKVEDGEAKPYRSRGFGGKGFKFVQEEVEQIRESRKKRKKDFVFSDSDTDSSGGEEKSQAKTSDMTIADLIKDKNVRNAAMSAAQTAAKAAILSGNPDKALSAAKEAIELVVMKLKSEPDVDAGIENVLKIRDEWVVKSAEDSGKSWVELDINDYPLTARSKVMSRDYLNTINDLTGCSISVRGTYIDPKKKLGMGQHRLHLFIEGPSRQHCNNARNEIKRFLEEITPNSYTNQLALMPF